MIQIFPTSVEWNHIRFRIQLMLADPSIELLKIYKYPNQLQQKYLNYMKVDCAINVTDMKNNDLEILKYGNSSRFVFEAGHMKLDNFSQTKNHSIKLKLNQTKHKILLFKIAMDQSMPIHKSGLSQLQKLSQFPQGIDTIYLSENKEELNIYPHKYKVKDKSQCCLQYEVDFICGGFENVQKWTTDQLMCQNCQIAKANYYCSQDKEIFCGKCFDQLHRSTKKKSHDRASLTPFNSAPYCPYHSKLRQTHYCLQCMDLKCESCIQNSSHKSEKKHTQIMALPDLQLTLKQKQAAFLKEAKQKTKALIMKAESTMAKLNKGYQHQKTLLQQQFTTKLVKIRDQTNKKTMRLISLHTELKRKYDELLWVQNFLHYCQDFLLADSNIQMKNSFFVYLQGITVREYYQQIDKKIEEVN